MPIKEKCVRVPVLLADGKGIEQLQIDEFAQH